MLNKIHTPYNIFKFIIFMIKCHGGNKCVLDMNEKGLYACSYCGTWINIFDLFDFMFKIYDR